MKAGPLHLGGSEDWWGKETQQLTLKVSGSFTGDKRCFSSPENRAGPKAISGPLENDLSSAN